MRLQRRRFQSPIRPTWLGRSALSTSATKRAQQVSHQDDQEYVEQVQVDIAGLDRGHQTRAVLHGGDERAIQVTLETAVSPRLRNAPVRSARQVRRMPAAE